MRGCPSFRAFRETAGTLSKPRRGGCPHPPGWGLFSRSRTESAFTYLSFRGAPRREPAFKYLSFRIRFTGEESAFCRGARSFSRSLRKDGDFFCGVEGNLLSHTCHSESALAVRNLLFKERTGMIAGVPQGLAAFARPGMRKTIHRLLSAKLAIGFSGAGICCSSRGAR